MYLLSARKGGDNLMADRCLYNIYPTKETKNDQQCIELLFYHLALTWVKIMSTTYMSFGKGGTKLECTMFFGCWFGVFFFFGAVLGGCGHEKVVVFGGGWGMRETNCNRKEIQFLTSSGVMQLRPCTPNRPKTTRITREQFNLRQGCLLRKQASI